MTTTTTPAIERGAATLRHEMNVCGDDRKCQCENSVTMSRDVTRVLLTDTLNVEEMARAGYAHRARRQIDAGDAPELWPYWSDLSDQRRQQEMDHAAAVRTSIVGDDR